MAARVTAATNVPKWILAPETTYDGNVSLLLQPLDDNGSDKVNLLSVIMFIQTQLREAGEEASVRVADNGVYSESNMLQLNQVGVKWVSWISEILAEARTVLQEGSDVWQHSEDGIMQWFCRVTEMPQGTEHRVIVRTQTSQQRVQLSM